MFLHFLLEQPVKKLNCVCFFFAAYKAIIHLTHTASGQWFGFTAWAKLGEKNKMNRLVLSNE